ncbi:MAG: hypothetical protein HZA61_02475 [Candidatus Eisenbacteria bacterium]|uniref:Uncharacterized protein n=1 Tax=Eiseniibacteriota bacterium TaxID=2212470 RepID=A0A933SAQ3_UNCEI|nr:hypothetical protein [Candidatus Eisenbacteria bacterium]
MAATPKSAARPARSTPAKGAAKGATAAPLTLVYGDDHVFGLVAPAGWAVDDTSGLGSRIRVVLYPVGQKWDTAPTVMYANVLHQDTRRPKTLTQMVVHDVEQFQKANPRGKVVAAPMMRTAKGRTAQVRWFAPDGGEPSEAVAYIEEPELVMLLVLSSRENGGFKKALPAFQSLVEHYEFVGGGIQTPSAR